MHRCSKKTKTMGAFPWLEVGNSVLGGGLNIFQNLLNKKATEKANADQMRFSRDMYDLQRRDALSDWNMQNAYNSPEQQMARLKAAGLNPHLVYGNGATAVSTQQVRSSQVESYKPNAPTYDLKMGGLGEIYDLQTKKIGQDVMQKNVENLEAERKLKLAQAMAALAGIPLTNIKTDKEKFDLDKAKNLLSMDMEAASLRNKKLGQDIDFSKTMQGIKLQENERAKVAQTWSINRAVADIARTRAATAQSEAEKRRIEQAIKNMEQDNRLKGFDERLRKKLEDAGFSSKDPWWATIFYRLASKMLDYLGAGESPAPVVDELDELIP